MKNITLLFVGLLIFFSVQCQNKKNNQQNTSKNMQSIYDFEMFDIDGNKVSLGQFKGKVMIIVNVASKCGLTPQYVELQEFYEQYKEKGVVVLGFPANNFGAQEPGTNSEIKEFCTKNYGVTFPMFAKISVKGDDIHPLYQYLTQKKLNGVGDFPVKWNFQKFIINKEGKLVESVEPTTTVTDSKFKSLIQSLL
jgi:glutathione peroxidase